MESRERAELLLRKAAQDEYTLEKLLPDQAAPAPWYMPTTSRSTLDQPGGEAARARGIRRLIQVTVDSWAS